MRSNILRVTAWLVLALLGACTMQTKETLKEGVWRGALQLEAGELPFQLEIANLNNQTVGYLINGDERILLDSISFVGDSIFIPMHIFNNSLRLTSVGDTLLFGAFVKHLSNQAYSIPVQLQWGIAHRFLPTSYAAEADFTGNWETYFYKSNGDSTPAVGIFSQKASTVTGTFLTPSGDYRYLDGMVTGRTLLLSAFDGDHAFLFQATFMGDSILHGQFWSGKSGYRVWKATRNAAAQLPDPDTLTRVVSADSTFSFDFPEYRGGRVQYPSAELNGQVVVLQVLGTWCPNCMDETRFLTQWLQEKQYKGVQVIGLAFEQPKDVAEASSRVVRMATRLAVPYPIGIAGVPDSTASAAIPAIDKLRAYPTTLIMDKKGKVRFVHTGFSGPGTGIHYEQFKERFDQRITALLKE